MAALHFPSVRLRTADAARLAEFYVNQLGFVRTTPASAAGPGVALGVPGADTPLLSLMEDRTARRAPPDAAGLFHAALLLPSRAALARWLRLAADAGTRFAGFSNHGVSEAIYLSDPEGNGLEFYADRPRDRWPFEHGELAMMTEPLALPDLLAAAGESTEPPLSGATWGHLHFRVTDLDRSEAFYRSTFGLAVTQHYGDSARFLAAGGYHHHIGLNTSGGVHQPQPPEALGFVEATISSPTLTSASELHDPDGLRFRLIAG